MAIRKKPKGKPRGKAFAKGEDPRRQPAPKGNKYGAKGALKEILEAVLAEPVEHDETGDKRERGEWAVLAMVRKAMEGEVWAQEMLWERMEGKVPSVAVGQVTQTHVLDGIVRDLPDNDLLSLLRVSKRTLDAQGIKTIEHIPGDE